jgi:tRNA-uridine 2-sulfurtransferase
VASRVIVALSGGVDSAVTALLMRRAGHQVECLFMHNWEEDEQGYCTAAEDFQDARRVAAELGVPLHSVDLSAQYRERVFSDFLAACRAGLTPNPDVLCNREIKFGDCLQHAQRLGGELLATGHYARLVNGAGGPELHKGVDAGKDQSYFLHAVLRERFSRVLMPLGELHKDQVREMARVAGLPVFNKRDSTGICFIGERPFREFLEQYVEHRPGPMVASGEVIGQHIGLAFYTLGQRAGIGIGGMPGSTGEAWYVVGKDPHQNVLTVAQGSDNEALFSRRLRTGRVNWLCVPPVCAPMPVAVRLRYRQEDQAASIVEISDNGVHVVPEQPQRAVTPGQSAVFYSGTRCLGGGVIERTDI